MGSRPFGWRLVSASVSGWRHVREGLPCQDFHIAAQTDNGSERCAVAVCADGAGSASRSDEGAEHACRFFFQQVNDRLNQGASPADFTSEELDVWLGQLRQELEAMAADEGV